jgi:hypothetical protein
MVINHDQMVYNKRFIMNKEHKRTIFFMTKVNMFPPKNKSRGDKNVMRYAMVEIPSFVENIPFSCVLL